MPWDLKVLIISLTVLILFFIFFSVKKKMISLKYALIWILACIFIVFVTLLSEQIEKISIFFGIKTLSNMMFFIAFIFIFLNLYYLTIVVSKQKQQIINLTQELGILKNNMMGKGLSKNNKQNKLESNNLKHIKKI